MQSDATVADKLILLLPSSTSRTALLTKITAGQSAITIVTQSAALTLATAGVFKAETSSLQVDITNAYVLITKLSASTQKTALTARVVTLQQKRIQK